MTSLLAARALVLHDLVACGTGWCAPVVGGGRVTGRAEVRGRVVALLEAVMR